MYVRDFFYHLMALNLKTLTTRTLTAAVFVAVLLSCINLNFVSFAALFFVVATWGLVEFYRLAEKLGAKPYRLAGVAAGVCFFTAGIFSNSNLALFYSPELIWIMGCVFLFGGFIQALFDKSAHTILNLAYTIMGLVYAVLPFILLLYITCINKAYTFEHPTGLWYHDCAPYNPHIIMGVILLIWASDSGAYLVGSLVGKNKLYERISPGKTWEGSIGATVLTIGCSYVISRWYPEISFQHWAAISIIVCVFGTLGDLVESMLKRQAGVKDSGKIMPGHGGILDRFDSLLFVTPFIYGYLYVVYAL
jgi:phosphatidate cytidylyltransferase